MAYGEAKGRIFRGDIYNEDDPNEDTFIDWGNDFISFAVGGTKVLNVSGASTIVKVLGTLSASVAVSASALVVSSGKSIILDGASNTFKLTNNGTNLDINGANIILNAVSVSASAPMTASAFVLGNGGRNVISDTGTDLSILAGSTGMFISADGGNLTLQGQVAIDTAGVLSSSVALSASTFYGDGSNLTAVSADVVDTTTDDSSATFYIPFVNQSTGQNGETVYIHDVLSVNPSSSLVQISETGQNTAALVISSSIGTANAYGGKDLGKITFPGTPGSAADALQIRGGYINMGPGNWDALMLAAPGTNAILFLTASNKVFIEGGAINFTGDIDSDGAITANNGIDVAGAQSNFSAAVSITGSTDVGLNVGSVYSGGASILSIGNILAGHTGGGNHTAHLNSNGNISGSADLNMGGDGAIKGGLEVGSGLDISAEGAVITGSTAISASANSTLFRVDGGDTSPVLFVSGSGRVGIGTDTPSHTLDVNGSLSVNGDITCGTDMMMKGAQQISFGEKIIANETLAAPFKRVYPVDTTAGAIDVILPAISATTHGLVLTIKDAAANANTEVINITGSTGSGDKIDGSGNAKTLNIDSQWATFVAQSSSSGTHVWYQIAGK